MKKRLRKTYYNYSVSLDVRCTELTARKLSNVLNKQVRDARIKSSSFLVERVEKRPLLTSAQLIKRFQAMSVDQLDSYLSRVV